MVIFFSVVGLGLALISTFFGIYRGTVTYKERKEKKTVAQFRRVRENVKKNRAELRRNALRKKWNKKSYLTVSEEIPLFFRQNWLPPKPIPLEKIDLQLKPDPGVKINLPTGSLPTYSGRKNEQYSDAIIALDKPKIFDDRIQYRLLQIENMRLIFSEQRHSYFDKINHGAYLVHELSLDSLRRSHIPKRSNRKRLLKHLRTPQDYVVLSGISTLTIIHDGEELRIIMHLRGETETAYAEGTYHVIPAGEFQPSCLATTSFDEDFDLWKNIIREYAEELLCLNEYDGNSTVPFDYSEEPFLSLENERANSNIKAFYLGTGLDPISFQGEILTAVVFKEKVFNKIFPNIINKNCEGKIITDKHRWGKQFTEKEFKSYRDANILATGEAILNTAWRNKHFFKKCFD